MTDNKPRKRLDEILLAEGMITDGQIRDALLRQKAQGGKFGSQLLYHRYLDEATLVKALEIQFGCKGIVLSNYDIPEILCEMIPRKVALTRKVIPFDYDPNSNILKVACEDPTDRQLVEEVSSVAQGKRVEFYVAAELPLNTALARYYLKQNVSLDDNLLLDIPDALTDSSQGIPIVNDAAAPRPPETLPEILLITDETLSTEHLQWILERDGYEVFVEHSPEDALSLIHDTKFHAVFVKDTLPGDHIDLIDRVRKISPATIIHYYHCASSLILDTRALAPEADMLVKNHDLVTSLLSSTAGLQTNHSGRVGRYADRLCRRLDLPDADRFAIVNAAYLHDFARYYYRIGENVDNRRVIGLTVKLLASINYQPVVLDMLQSMYCDIRNQPKDGLPINVLGGSILTCVDLFCDRIPEDGRLSVSRLDAIRKHLRDMSGRLFLTDVGETFIGMIQDEFLNRHAARRKPQVMIYSEDPVIRQGLDLRMKNEGFRTIVLDSRDRITELYHRSDPDMMILSFGNDNHAIEAFIDWISGQGISFQTTPTFLLADASIISRLTRILEKGVEDIIAHQNSLDFLITKLNKFRAKRESANAGRRGDNAGEPGAHGHLADMNIIDLIQALGPGLKTVRISVQPAVQGAGELVLYLNQGAIVYAGLDELAGVEAIYEGLTWTDGVWSIESVPQTDIPHPNIEAPNESILMEGCRLLDERTRAGVPL